jgi:hypothetical protein
MNMKLWLSALLILAPAGGCSRTPETVGSPEQQTPIGQAAELPDPAADQPAAPPAVVLPELSAAVESPDTIQAEADANPPSAAVPTIAETLPDGDQPNAQPQAAPRAESDNFDLIEAMLSQYEPKREETVNPK